MGKQKHHKQQRRSNERHPLTPRSSAALLEPQATLPQRVQMDLAERNPGLLRLAQRVRENPRLMGVEGMWKPWCYMPINVMGAIVYRIHEGEIEHAEVETAMMPEVRLACAISGWRMTKSVYVYDESFLDEIANSKAKDGLPDELFLRLPDWCPYISTPNLHLFPGLVMHGFFVHVDDRGFTGGIRPPELNFSVLIDPKRCDDRALMSVLLIDREAMTDFMLAARGDAEEDETQLEKDTDAIGSDFNVDRGLRAVRCREYLHMPMQVTLGLGGFKNGLRELTSQVLQHNLGDHVKKDSDHPQAVAWKMSRELFVDPSQSPLNDPDRMATVQKQLSEKMLQLASVALYLCAEEPDISPPGWSKGRQRVMDEERKRGGMTHEPKCIIKWDVGCRIGAQLRPFRSGDERPGSHASGDEGESGRSQRPHVRSAHWHSFWSGPRNDPSQQVLRVKWLSPITVNAISNSDLVTTVRSVAERPPRSVKVDDERSTVH